MTQRRFEVEWNAGGRIERAYLLDVAGEELEHAWPIRKSNSYRGQYSLPGVYFFDTTGQLKPYESRLERTYLLRADFDRSVVDVASQPFRLHYRRAGKKKRHTPDFFARHRDGSAEVIDVKQAHRVGRPEVKAVFDVMEEACDSVAWRFSIVTEMEPLALANLEFLAGFRAAPPQAEDILLALLDHADSDEPLSIGQLLAKTKDDVMAKPALFHLLWHQVLITDLRAPLSNRSLVVLSNQKGSMS